MRDLGTTGMLIDGCFTSEVWDSSGEVLDLAGCDISEMEEGRGTACWEHRHDESPGASATDTVGKIVYVRKVFTREDCEDDRQRFFWDKVKAPYLYGIVRLYDGAGHAAAKDLAAQVRDHVANGEQILVRFSIDGSTLERKGNILKTTIARKVAVTLKPCNKTCDSGLLLDPHAPEGFEKEPALTKSEDPMYGTLGWGEYTQQDLPQAELAKAVREKKAKKPAAKAPDEWVSEDGLTIPSASHPDRPKWDAAFASALRRQYGAGRPALIDVARAQPANDVRNFNRLDLYQRMLEGGDKLPPLVVRQNHMGDWDIIDGSHRWAAAKAKGVEKLPALDVSSVRVRKSVAPGALTGQAALTREDLAKRLEAVIKAWNESKGPLRDFLKTQLTDVDPQYVEHFADVAENMVARLRKARKGADEPVVTPEGDVEPGKGRGRKLRDDDEENTADIDTGKPLTIRGRPVPPNPELEGKGEGVEFNEHTGVLKTPRGTFPMHNPDKHGESGDAFRDVWQSEAVRRQHDYAMRNWIQVHEALKAGRLPESVLATATIFSQLSPNCLDAETEALTRRGWIKGFDLRRDDILLTKNPKTGLLEWQPMLDLRLFPDYEGPLVHLHSRSFDFVTTPDHRWMVTSPRGKVTEKTSMTLKANDRIHRTGAYVASESVLSDDEAELLGWFVTDGFIRKPREKQGTKTPRVMLVQSPEANPEKCDRIQECLERTQQDFSTYSFPKDRKRVWRLGKVLTEKLLALAPERTLKVETLLQLGSSALHRLREAMLLGDGTSWKGEEGWAPKETLITGRQEQADAFQALLVLTGSSSAKVWRDMSKYEPKSALLKNVPKCNGVFEVNIANRKITTIKPEHRREYVGKVGVWCPVVKNTFFVARRNGCITITGNTPVSTHELMYSHHVDSTRALGYDARDPRFASEAAREDWLSRDQPGVAVQIPEMKQGRQPSAAPGGAEERQGLPRHSQDYFMVHDAGIGDMVRLKNASKASGRQPGQIGGFMLAQNKYDNMEQYHTAHDKLVDLVTRHGADTRSAVRELMTNKDRAVLWEAARKRHQKKGNPDIGPYQGVHIPGLAPKTARFTYSMLGGGNSFVPDTHFSRHLFGLDKNLDGATIRHIRNTVLWNPKYSELLNAMDRWYYRNHPAVKMMLQHPEFGAYFRANPEQAVFGSFWGNWLAISKYEAATGHKDANVAFNQKASHRPLFEEIERMMNDPVESAKTVPARTSPIVPEKSPRGFVTYGGKPVKKSDASHPPMISPHLAAHLLRHWVDTHGEAEASLRYYAHLVPLLMHSAAEDDGDGVDLVKAEHLSVEVLRLAKQVEEQGTAPGWKKTGVPTSVTVPQEKPHEFRPEGDIYNVPDPQKTAPVFRPKSAFREHHGSPLNTTPEQKALIHGVDLAGGLNAEELSDNSGNNTTYFVKHPDGRPLVVKADASSYRGGAHREVAYYNLARDFFGLGHYLPLTAAAHDPHGRSVGWSFHEMIPDAEHHQWDDPHQDQVLKDLGDRGELHRLAFMNAVMGNTDRHQGNYMFDRRPGEMPLKLIDHGHTFAENRMGRIDPVQEPHYLARYRNISPDFDHKRLHPAARQWIESLEPVDIYAHARKMGLNERTADWLSRSLEQHKESWLNGGPLRRLARLKED